LEAVEVVSVAIGSFELLLVKLNSGTVSVLADTELDAVNALNVEDVVGLLLVDAIGEILDRLLDELAM
jgi:hypothetical protein